MRTFLPTNVLLVGVAVRMGGAYSAPLISNARVTALRKSPWATGLQRKSVAPVFMAVTTVKGEDAPETIITRTLGAVRRTSPQGSDPARRVRHKSRRAAALSTL